MKADLKDFIKVIKAIISITDTLDFAPKEEIEKTTKIPGSELTKMLGEMEKGGLIRNLTSKKGGGRYVLSLPPKSNAKIDLIVTK